MARNNYPEETVKLILDEALKLFLEKGYEATTIQDIIDNLGGLSKGAIYHHFKSKDEIFEAVGKKIALENVTYYHKIRDDKSKNGIEKLRAMIKSSYSNPTNDTIMEIRNKMASDPKFFINQVFEIYELVAPVYVQPIIEQGIRDGSITTAYPKELAEALITLLTIWMNPIVARGTPEQMRNKLNFLSLLLKSIGIDIFDEDTIEQYVEFGKRYN